MRSKTRLLIGVGAAAWLAANVYAQSYWISTVAGSDRRRDGMPAAGTPLNYPSAAVIDRNGTLFIADSGDRLIRKVTPAGTIGTYAGTGSAGFSGDGGPAGQASLNNLSSLAVDSAGNLYVADLGNYRIRKIDSAGVITTIAGTGKPSYGAEFPEGGPAESSVITPRALAVDSKGNIYVSDVSSWFAMSGAQFDTGTHFVVRKIDTAGTITTIAGTGLRGYSGDGGPAIQARIADVTGIAVDAAGNVYLCDA
jgi:sugar lactone lactonase YvrE